MTLHAGIYAFVAAILLSIATVQRMTALARRAGAGRLMLTHLRPTLDPARSVEEAEATFGRPVELAVPGLETDV